MGAAAQERTDAEVVDPAAVENAAGGSEFVILCDHASNFIPARYDSLGLTAEERGAHIAWDPGALAVARGLSRHLDAPLVHATVSRLVVDCNRQTDARDLMAARSETTTIPGNSALTEADRRARLDAIYEPYHAAIEALLGRRAADGMETSLVAVHSFTPVYAGEARPWDVGILFDKDSSLADTLIAALRADDAISVGVNEPYSPADGVYHTLALHGQSRGLRTVMVEIRNDHIRSEAGAAAWARRIGRALASDAPDPVPQTGDGG